MGFSQRLEEVRTGFERPFWVANISELWERRSYDVAFASRNGNVTAKGGATFTVFATPTAAQRLSGKSRIPVRATQWPGCSKP